MAIETFFYDYYKLTKPSGKQLEEFSDYLQKPNSLFVKMEATHAAIINGNFRYYIPSRMKDGVASFRINDKPTKILKHHDAMSDPVGVVRGARFVPTVPSDLNSNPDVMTLMSDSAPIKKQLASMRNLWKAGVLNRDDWRGLGYIELLAEISDGKTIEQIKDGRFDAVSTSFRSPGNAFCSICAQNLAKDGYCEHEMGEMYEDDTEHGHKLPAIVIPGKHIYKETSFIVFDADPLTSVEIVDTDNIENNKTYNLTKEDTEDLSSDKVFFEFTDSVKEGTMKLTSAEQKVFDAVKALRKDMEDSKVIEFTKTIVGSMKDGKLPDQEEAELEDSVAIQYALEDLETKDEEIDGDKTCDDMREELKEMQKEGLISEEEFKAADAKLTTEQRKRLGGSTFCGPKRSFPVPDCAHVTAARRLIGRYKGPGSKSSILACVSRKAKALGCKGAKDSEPNTSNDSVPCKEKTLKDMTENELRALFHSAELELIDRKLTVQRECSDCALHVQKAEEAEKALKDYKENFSDIENDLAVLRKELRRSYQDVSDQVDAFLQLKVDFDTYKKDNLAMIGVLANKYDNIDIAMEELNKSNLADQETIIMDSFNLESVLEKVNDGMARDPQGTVADPTAGQDMNDDEDPYKDLPPGAKAVLEEIKEDIKDGEIIHAQGVYGKMVQFGVIDANKIKFDTLLAEAKGDTANN
jgi:hypothetical protein